MNFVLSSCFVVRILKNQVVLALFLAVLFSIYLVGCSEQVRLPSPEGLAEFESAGPVRPTVDMDNVVSARIGGGPYRVVPGDVLEVSIPAILQVFTAELPDSADKVTPYVCRVSDNGTITFPLIGEIEVAGKSLAEIESAVIDAYYPKYSVIVPPVVARILEYNTSEVSIIGAVQKPGVYSLRNDQMSLVALLMEAEGIVAEGAALIRITHPEEAVADRGEVARETLQRALQLVTGQAHERTIERSAQLNEAVAPAPPADNPGTKQIEVQLAFSQLPPSETTGLLTMKHNDTILLTEQLDISSEIQRQAVIEKLAQKGPRFSTKEVNYRLCELAELLKPGSDRYNSEKETAGKNINSSAKLTTSDSKRNTFSEEALEKDLLEILELEKSLGMWKTANAEESALKKPQPLVLPVKGLNIPFADVALQEGDAVEVERLELPLFTVIGLVNRPGNFPYPPDVQYNLMQALAFAGGFNQTAEPRYATVYRKKADGTIVNATFKVVDSSKLTNALNILIKPGDIVAVEHTSRTRTKLFLDRVFRINFGVYAPLYLLGRQRD